MYVYGSVYLNLKLSQEKTVQTYSFCVSLKISHESKSIITHLSVLGELLVCLFPLNKV